MSTLIYNFAINTQNIQLCNYEISYFRGLLQNNSIYKTIIYLVKLSQDRQIAMTHNSSNKLKKQNKLTLHNRVHYLGMCLLVS